MKVRRLYTDTDMARAFNQGFTQGWTRRLSATDPHGVVRYFEAWLEENYPEFSEAALRAREGKAE